MADHALEAVAARVELLVFDVDGTLTDGGLYYGPDGEALKRFDVKDGHALVMARLAGLQLALLTARNSKTVATRAAELKIPHVLQGRRDKGVALGELLQTTGVAAEACAYMGDDVNDWEPLSMVALPACPADAAAEIRSVSRFISTRPGGHGAARELVEFVLRCNGKWPAVLDMMKSVRNLST